MSAARATLAALIAAASLGAAGCDDDGEPALFPADYAATYQEVRNCRFSLEHDLMRIRVLAAPDALAVYTGRTGPFPEGAVVLKEEYADTDTACAGPIVSFTAMQKLPAGASPATLDWTWQETDARRKTLVSRRGR